MNDSNTWPLVKPDDDGIRPGKGNERTDQCLYCRQVVGSEHLKDCDTVKRQVRIRVTLELNVEVPYFWTQKDIEFHRGRSSWCANNIVRDQEQYLCDNEKNNICLCENFSTEFLKETDRKPISRTRGEEIDRHKRLHS